MAILVVCLAAVLWDRKLILWLAIWMLVFSFLFPGYLHRAGETFSDAPPSGLTSRIELWNMGVELFLEKPLYGYGIGNYNWERYDRVRHRDDFSEHQKRLPPHNSYLLVASELGILGMVPFLGSLVAAAAMAGMRLDATATYRALTRVNGAPLSLLAIMIHANSNSLFHYPEVALPFWVLFAVES